MNPCVARGGSSFRGAFQYYMHDKETDTRERIAWTHTENMLTQDPDRAWKVMAYTAQHQSRLKEASGQVSTGRKCEKPVMAYSLSWHPDQHLDKDHMLDMALKSLKVLELQEHECMIVAHRDTPHKHVHIIVNRIHPISGLVASNSHSYRKLSSFALEYAREHGLKYCPQREENARKREQGKKTEYRDNRIQEAWNSSDDGKSLIAALEASGLTLAHGNKRLVVLDSKGKAINPVRHIEGIRAKDFRAKLADIDLGNTPTVDEVLKQAKKTKSKELERPQKQQAQDKQKLHKKADEFMTELHRFHRIGEQQTTIEQLETKIKKAPWWRKIFGLIKKDRAKLEKAQHSYAESKSKLDRQIEMTLEIRDKRIAEPESRRPRRKLSFENKHFMNKNQRLDHLNELRDKDHDKGLSRDM